MKTALVSGANRGIGLEWCRQLAGLGYTVILCARDESKALQAMKSLRSEGLEVLSHKLDVRDEKQITELSAWFSARFGHLDLLVNNAGINPLKPALSVLQNLNEAELLDVYATNSIAPIMMVKHFRPVLTKARSPVVINISSLMGSVSNLGSGAQYAYSASKNLLNFLNKTMAYDLYSDKIISVNLNPGWVRTDMGGKSAPLSPAESVESSIKKVLHKLSLSDTGKFFNYDGTPCPW
ncbi:MAG TPA: SDR family oxidoreductase [Bacteroidia bacterium]|nr:SDR family oxidoreductase [Bacteroidia bacterium]